MEVTVSVIYLLILNVVLGLMVVGIEHYKTKYKQLQKDYEEAQDESFNDLLNLVGLSEKLKIADSKQEEFRCYCRDAQSYIQHLEELLKVNNINIDQVKKTQERIEEEDSLINTVVP